ncbi:MAG: hypothetical protein OXK74_08905 [Gemmatimonadota bacterium]|nr:hypothetical protein [Gemmatimonadota bacterium]
MLRTFDMAPPIVARFHLNGREVHVAHVGGIAFDMLADTIAPSATIPASVIKPGLEMAVDWNDGRFPASGRLAVEVVRLPPLKLTLIPLVLKRPDPGRCP